MKTICYSNRSKRIDELRSKVLHAMGQKRLFVLYAVLALISVSFQLLFISAASAFQIGDRVKATANVNVRTCPFLWCDPPVGVIPTGGTGRIINGSYSGDGYTWWYIGWDSGLTGYSVQNYLAVIPGTFSLSYETPVCDTSPPGPSPAVRLNWTTSSNATYYDVYRNGSLYVSNNPGNTFYNSANLVAGQSYTYFIKARNSSGSQNSNTISVSIPSNICAAPSPQITIGPLSLNFGSVQAGSCSSAQFAIQHVSNTDTASGSVSISQNPPFRVTSNGSFSLSNGQAVNVGIEFCPSSSGSFSGAAVISSNADQNVNSVSLSGTGSVPSPTTGAIQVNAKLDGTSWSGSVNYSVSGAQSFSGNSVPADFQNRPQGSYTLAYVSGGPTNATFAGTTPSSIQTLNGGSVITYTLNFTSSSTGTLDHFVFWNISSQNPGVPFNVTVTAADAAGSRVLTFNGQVWLRSSFGRVYPTEVNLANGQATVSVRVDYDGRYKLTCSGYGAYGESNSFDVGSGGSCTGKIFGRVVDANNAALSQADVTLYNSAERLVNRVQTDVVGKYSFSGLCTDTYRVEVQKEDFKDTFSGNEVTGAMGVQLNDIQLQINGGSGVIPVILVPGMMGSTTLLNWFPTLSGSPPCDNLALWDGFLGYSPVGWNELKGVLKPAGFKWQDCPWDWRMEVQKGPIESLKKAIDDALNLPGVTVTKKVHIVAHSMGGLLVRAYIQSEDYREDIAKVAFVGTPHLGSCDPYYIWEGGDPALVDNIKDSGLFASLVNVYNKTLGVLLINYSPFLVGTMLYVRTLPSHRRLLRDFLHKEVKSLRQLMHTEAFLYDEADWSLRGVESIGNKNTLLDDLNQGNEPYKNPHEVMSPDGAGNTVEAILFVGKKSDSTIRRVRTKGKGKTDDLYEDGIPTWPKRLSAIKGMGDGTVPYESATWPSEDGWACLHETQLPGEHLSLIGAYKNKIVNFLQGTSASDTEKEISSAEETAPTSSSVLTCFVFGNMRLLVTSAAGQKTGIDPSTQTPVDNIPSSSSSFSAESGGVSIENPAQGVYSVTYFGERNQDFRLDIGYTDDSVTESYNFQGFRPSSNQTFTVSVNPSATPRITITPPVKAPTNFQANPYTSGSTEKTRLTWNATGESGLTGYNIYAVAELEPYFTKVTTVGTGTTSYSTSDAWSSIASTMVKPMRLQRSKQGASKAFSRTWCRTMTATMTG